MEVYAEPAAITDVDEMVARAKIPPTLIPLFRSMWEKLHEYGGDIGEIESELQSVRRRTLKAENRADKAEAKLMQTAGFLDVAVGRNEDLESDLAEAQATARDALEQLSRMSERAEQAEAELDRCHRQKLEMSHLALRLRDCAAIMESASTQIQKAVRD